MRSVVLSSGVVATIAGSGATGYTNGVGSDATFRAPWGVSLDPEGVAALVVSFCRTSGVVVIISLYLLDLALQTDQSNNLLRLVTLSSGRVTTLAGGKGTNVPGYADGIGSDATFAAPTGVAIDSTGTFALVVSFRHDQQ